MVESDCYCQRVIRVIVNDARVNVNESPFGVVLLIQIFLLLLVLLLRKVSKLL